MEWLVIGLVLEMGIMAAADKNPLGFCIMFAIVATSVAIALVNA